VSSDFKKEKALVLEEVVNIMQLQFKQFNDKISLVGVRIEFDFRDLKDRCATEHDTQLMSLIELLQSTLKGGLAERKVAFLGCKMEIYQQRMRSLSFHEVYQQIQKKKFQKEGSAYLLQLCAA